jgi:hypothetical protein
VAHWQPHPPWPNTTPTPDEEYLILCWGTDPGGQQDVEGKDQAQGQGRPVTVARIRLIHIAAFHGSIRCASLLLSRGANPGLKTTDGLSAYDVSSALGPCRAARAAASLQCTGAHF